jgi:hypothetical protein
VSAPLQHVYPRWELSEEDPTADPRLIWPGRMRIVGRQRARKLRRRGVPITRSVKVTSRGRHRHAWFVEGETDSAGPGASGAQQ